MGASTTTLAPQAGATTTTAPQASTTTTTTPTTTPTGQRTSAWASFGLVASPNAGANHNVLRGVAATAPAVWAVGDYYNGKADRTLVERSTGGVWAVMASPNASAAHNELDAVAALSPDDVWAVGRYSPGIGQDRSLIEHWNGSSWSLVPSAQQGLYHNELDGVAVVSPTDAWAVGHYDVFATASDEALIEHWDGHRWAIASSPHPSGQHSGLVSVAVDTASGSAWAVGYAIVGKVTRTLVERWSGNGWSIVPSPDVGVYHNELDSVCVLSATDAWAVGWYFNGVTERTLIEHWDGSSWSTVASPDANNGHNVLAAVGAVSADEVFAVGDFFGGVNDETLVVQWNGRRWQVDTSADSSQHLHNELDSVAAELGTGAVAVGTSYDGTADRTLVERSS